MIHIRDGFVTKTYCGLDEVPIEDVWMFESRFPQSSEKLKQHGGYCLKCMKEYRNVETTGLE